MDTLQVRQFLEAFAAGIAAERIDEEGIANLERIVIKNTRAANEGDIEALITGDEEFHNAIMYISGNKTIPRMSSIIQDLIVRFRNLYYKQYTYYKTMPAEHRKIFAAIRAHNSEEARTVAAEHVNKLTKFVMGEGREALRKTGGYRERKNLRE